MVIELLWLLVAAVVLCIVVYIAFWILEAIGEVKIPDKIKKLIWLVVALIILIWVVTALMGYGPIPLRLGRH